MKCNECTILPLMGNKCSVSFYHELATNSITSIEGQRACSRSSGGMTA